MQLNPVTQSMDGDEKAAISDRDFYQQLQNAQLAPLWESLKGLVPSEPKPKAIPWKWDFSEVRRYLMQAGEMITAEEAERRVLILSNPGLDGKLQITDTIYAGIQLILPGETAPPHRHSQSALRFVIEGHSATTTVNGECTQMSPGDFIITPSMTWHEHSGGDEPVIWLDGLDVPLSSFLHTGFREENTEGLTLVARPIGQTDALYARSMLPLQPIGKPLTSPIFNYPYERSREALEKLKTGPVDPWLGIALRYVNPTSGDWAMPTIGTSLRLLPAGFISKPYRSTDGLVMSVTEGSMTLRFANTTLKVNPKDVIAVPGWVDYTVEAHNDTVVFAFSDRPVHEKLGLWRERRSTATLK